MQQPTTWLTASDGIRLAVTESGDPALPAILCVHGYPDNGSVWTGVTADLSRDHHVVVYDVRGAGHSGRPAVRSGYRLDQLVDDLAAVADVASPRRRVHLLAHDWGSIQAWHAVTGTRMAGRIASFTTISGPCLDHAAHWMRAQLRPDRTALRNVTRQFLHSSYIGLFLLPWLPEQLWRSGILDRALGARAGTGKVHRFEDRINGLELYRANMPHRFRRPGARRTDIPVQVIAPDRDRYVTPELQTQAPEPFTADLRVRTIPGGHWVIVTAPELVAAQVREFVASVPT